MTVDDELRRALDAARFRELDKTSPTLATNLSPIRICDRFLELMRANGFPGARELRKSKETKSLLKRLFGRTVEIEYKGRGWHVGRASRPSIEANWFDTWVSTEGQFFEGSVSQYCEGGQWRDRGYVALSDDVGPPSAGTLLGHIGIILRDNRIEIP